MKRYLLTGMALLALVAPAYAADLPPPILKAPPIVGYPYTGSGVYAGIGAVGAVANVGTADALGNTQLAALGAALELTAGYQFGLGANWAAVEVGLQYTNIGATTVVPGILPGSTAVGSVNSKWGFEERAMFGFPIQSVLAVLPNLNVVFPGLPALPAGVTPANTTQHPYIYAFLREDDVTAVLAMANGAASFSGQAWQIQPGIGAGIRQQWTNGLVVDTSAGCTFAGTGFTLGGPPGMGGASANLGRDCRAKVGFLY